MKNDQPLSAYKEALKKHSGHLVRLEKKGRRLGWLRLAVFLVTAIASYKIFIWFGIAGVISIITGIAVLLYLVSLDSDNRKQILNTKTLIKINEEEIDLLHHQYGNRYDGLSFGGMSHDYASDLDLFGPSSLFQYLNRCYTDQGRFLLATNLLSPLPVAEITDRHAAMKELVADCEWCQQLQAYAMQSHLTKGSQRRLEDWLLQKEQHFTASFWKALIIIWPVVTIGSVLLAMAGYIPVSVFSSLFVLYVIVSGIIVSRGAKDYSALSGIINEIGTMFHMLHWIENKEFSSPLLTRLTEEARFKGKSPAKQIRKLEFILNRMDVLLNMIASTLLNGFLLWGVRQMLALNEWKMENKEGISKWFLLIAQFETINSLAVLCYNQPEWNLPTFTDQHFTLAATEVGHPLILPQQRVTNDFCLEGSGKIALITGSNMAGKSTFLRSLGVNIILAQIGAPVCAKTFLLSPVRLMSSMRVADNLAENTSTFYAELTKLKTIIDAVNRHEAVFILLDEILRGTNSLDRHTGSKALIAQMIKEHTVAAIATHDVELASLNQSMTGAIENYHFDVQVAGEELYFDYKLKKGVCTSLNASMLMKKIGINLATG